MNDKDDDKADIQHRNLSLPRMQGKISDSQWRKFDHDVGILSVVMIESCDIHTLTAVT